VVIVNSFKTEEEAIEIANDTQYGLHGKSYVRSPYIVHLSNLEVTASVYTTNFGRAMRFAKGFEAGIVGVNCGAPEQVNPIQFSTVDIWLLTRYLRDLTCLLEAGSSLASDPRCICTPWRTSSRRRRCTSSMNFKVLGDTENHVVDSRSLEGKGSTVNA
jgi:hypothetical protein